MHSDREPDRSGEQKGLAEDHSEQEKPNQHRSRGNRMAQLRSACGEIAEAGARMESGQIVMLWRPHQMGDGVSRRTGGERAARAEIAAHATEQKRAEEAFLDD